MTTYTGRDLLNAGYPQGPGFADMLNLVNEVQPDRGELQIMVDSLKPAPRMQLQASSHVPLQINLEADTEEEKNNLNNVIASMTVLSQTPTVTQATVMPDAMPAGPLGTIPVGGVVSTLGTIHPGMHSADICCSMMVTEFADADPAWVMDAIFKVTHFGRGGRPNGARFSMSPRLYDSMRANPFLQSNKAIQLATEQMGTQGDGNHFAFVGINNAGNACLVTHHGSRGPGAFLYAQGMKAAQKHTHRVAEGVLKQNAWLDYDSEEGQSYWEALQIIRKWTKANHSCLHTAAADLAGYKVKERFWNEHNFVFKDGDTFHHAKGATPINNAFMPDSAGRQIVPLNMTQPVLIIEGETNETNNGFAPHGAGRNLSRTAHKKSLDQTKTDEEIFAEETKDILAISWCGEVDVTELPSAYKDGPKVREQMERMNLAKVVDEIQPFGSIMAGDIDKNAPWRLKREAKLKEKAQANV